MKCYVCDVSTNPDEYQRAEVYSSASELTISFEGDTMKEITMRDPEILFYGTNIHITGYVRVGEGKGLKQLWQLRGFDVKFRK